MKAGVRVALAAVPVALGITCATVAQSAPGPVQPGVTTPSAPAPGAAPTDTPAPPAPAPAPDDQPVELHQAAPQTQAPAPQYNRPRPTPTPDPTPDPAPRTVRIGDNDVVVPDAVPDQVVQGLQNALNPGGQPPQQ
ncbi:hypothetical protein [Nocardia sp. alder85J]|uniref:hypothetical protein n=1 Tax=Nocardia sp. alder85J TaxID=2862949 RepID=UPI001CD7F6E8|nr:hypothetical protein [Nocardia sp. alder85J]MCX4098933.1 hypothetical protein [Nocardia sp. alder85J]